MQWRDTRVVKTVGHQVRPIDWVEKTDGTARYAADQLPEETLVTKILRSPYPHARIKSINVDAALRVPGVHAVITAKDFRPGAVYEHSGAPYSDRPPLATDRVLYVGHEIAAVAAETVAAAEEAVAQIRVRYRRLRAASSVEEALGFFEQEGMYGERNLFGQ